MESHDIEPHFRVLECQHRVGPRKWLVSRSITVGFQSSVYEFPLILRQELCSLRIIVYEFICSNGHDRCEQPLINLSARGPPFLYGTWGRGEPAVTSRMKIHLHPFRPPTPLMCAIPQAMTPPKAPANDAAEKNRAIRYCISFRLYHMLK